MTDATAQLTDATAQFFERLGQHGHEPSLEKATGTIGVELEDDRSPERWLVSMDKGDIAVSRGDAGTVADCTFTMQKALFDEIVQGRANALAGVIRGAIGVEGDPTLLVQFQKFLPGQIAVEERSG